MFSLGISGILKQIYVGISILIPRVLFFLQQNFMFRWYSEKFMKDQWKKEECLSVCSLILLSFLFFHVQLLGSFILSLSLSFARIVRRFPIG
jgi:hypothetical protein